ncbi:hypothetical protein BDM02DRAFT_2799609 [Thelephora ganbajun]|uniref:Uncharacterized protein n=1 Tax=Thelephora ganbajun TaxID=370292 RepID=A0ACB6ZC30_THEGA|nr:hypothetical protein BDM02DRAFT_2799609 [Thelephora ganbajun]
MDRTRIQYRLVHYELRIRAIRLEHSRYARSRSPSPLFERGKRDLLWYRRPHLQRTFLGGRDHKQYNLAHYRSSSNEASSSTAGLSRSVPDRATDHFDPNGNQMLSLTSEASKPMKLCGTVYQGATVSYSHETFHFEDGNVEIVWTHSFPGSFLNNLILLQPPWHPFPSTLPNAPMPKGCPRIVFKDSAEDFVVLSKMIYAPGLCIDRVWIPQRVDKIWRPGKVILDVISHQKLACLPQIQVSRRAIIGQPP